MLYSCTHMATVGVKGLNNLINITHIIECDQMRCYLEGVDPGVAATSVTGRAEQAGVTVGLHSLRPPAPEQWLHAVVLWTDLQDTPNTWSLAFASSCFRYKQFF